MKVVPLSWCEINLLIKDIRVRAALKAEYLRLHNIPDEKIYACVKGIVEGSVSLSLH